MRHFKYFLHFPFLIEISQFYRKSKKITAFKERYFLAFIPYFIEFRLYSKVRLNSFTILNYGSGLVYPNGIGLVHRVVNIRITLNEPKRTVICSSLTYIPHVEKLSISVSFINIESLRGKLHLYSIIYRHHLNASYCACRAQKCKVTPNHEAS